MTSSTPAIFQRFVEAEWVYVRAARVMRARNAELSDRLLSLGSMDELDRIEGLDDEARARCKGILKGLLVDKSRWWEKA